MREVPGKAFPILVRGGAGLVKLSQTDKRGLQGFFIFLQTIYPLGMSHLDEVAAATVQYLVYDFQQFL